ncbi:MAG: SGNH/GDSL hydrolase family protein [Verrucomicrobia bacterium]|nr:SGNH/GDSL hydrolase family protein [Verrucomicrobiota bacterium]
MTTQLQTNETILFIGDSITDCGRMDPNWKPHGSGYVGLFADLLAVREPEKAVTVINTGIGGHTVADLRDRWIDDALSHKPDWLSVKIGINDCHRHLESPDPNSPQSPEAYDEIYDRILDIARTELPDVKLLLIDPFYCSLDLDGKVEGSHRARVHDTLPAYTQTCDRLGEKYNARRVKTHDLFHEHFKHQHPGVYFPNEPVHPNRTGHMLIAEAVFDALS